MVLNTEELLEIYQNLPVVNRTYTYLFPSLYSKNIALFSRLQSLLPSIVGVFINDENFADSLLIKDEPAIFVVFNTRVQHIVLQSQLNWIRTQKEYITEYPYCGREKFLIIVLRTNELVYTKFLEGKYSQMYTPEEIELTPFIVNRMAVIAVLKREQIAKTQFARLLEITFGSSFTEKDLEPGAECELPPIYSDSTRFFESITL